MSNLSEFLKTHMKTNGITFKRLFMAGKQTDGGISYSYLHRIVSGKVTTPSILILDKIAGYIGIEAAVLYDAAGYINLGKDSESIIKERLARYGNLSGLLSSPDVLDLLEMISGFSLERQKFILTHFKTFLGGVE